MPSFCRYFGLWWWPDWPWPFNNLQMCSWASYNSKKHTLKRARMSATYFCLAVELFIVVVLIVGLQRKILKNDRGAICQVIRAKRVHILKLSNLVRALSDWKFLIFEHHADFHLDFSLEERDVGFFRINVVELQRGVVTVHHWPEVADIKSH